MQRKRKEKINLKNVYKKKQTLIIILLVISMVSFATILGRYITNNVNDFFVRSKEFYFFSDKLTEDNSIFQIENWSGVDDYVITINMNSRKNNIEVATYDIGYNITYTCTDNAICQLSKNSGVISGRTNTDFFNLTITPNTQLDTGDKVIVEIEATSTSNYEKILKGRFTLVVGQENLTYQITDKQNEPYMELSITNTLSYYIVNQAFGEYKLNQKIDIDTYLALSDTDKAKCHSKIATISFDPNQILLDLTSENFGKAINSTNELIDGKTYINSLTIPIDAISSVDLRFYKVDVFKNYTYPNLNNYSVVNITSR